MVPNPTMSDSSLLSELGRRIVQQRIDRSWTQAHLAEVAGIGKRTLERMEAGESVQLVSFIRVLRALKLLPNMDALLPAAGPRPMDYLKQKRETRQRASAPRTEKADPQRWKWGDER